MKFVKNIWNKISGKSGYEEEEVVIEEKKPLRSIIAGFVESGVEHIVSLGELFSLELQELTGRLKCKIICFLLGFFFMLIAYFCACVALIVFLGRWMDVLWAVLCVCGGHALIGGGLLLTAALRKIGPVAPKTTNEIKSDYQCLRLFIKENKNS